MKLLKDFVLEVLNKTEENISFDGFLSPSYIIWSAILINSQKRSFDVGSVEKNSYLHRCNLKMILGIDGEICTHTGWSANLVEIVPIMRDTNKDRDVYEATTKKHIDTIAAKFIKSIWWESREEVKKYTQAIYGTIDYILRELIDNVYTHSGDSTSPHTNLYMMQYYPATNILRICIADNGIWIKTSYTDTKYHEEDEEDEFYINLSLKRNVSSTFEKVERNPGNGLHISSELVKAMNSKMTIMSGNAVVEIWQTKQVSYTDVAWEWTLIDLEFDLSQLSDPLVLKRISTVNQNDYSEDDQEAFDSAAIKEQIDDLFV